MLYCIHSTQMLNDLVSCILSMRCIMDNKQSGDITDGQGNKTVRDFYNCILGFCKKSRYMTTDFYGRINSINRGEV